MNDFFNHFFNPCDQGGGGAGCQGDQGAPGELPGLHPSIEGYTHLWGPTQDSMGIVNYFMDVMRTRADRRK